MKEKDVREGEIVLKRTVLDISLEEESPENYTIIFVWIFFFLMQCLPVWYVAKGTHSFAEFQIIIIFVSGDLFIYDQLK